MAFYCHRCGSEVLAGAAYCKICGARMAIAKRRHGWKYVVIAFIVVAGVGAAYIGFVARPFGLKWVYSSAAGIKFTKAEITVAQFKQCVYLKGCKGKNKITKSEWGDCNWGHSDRDDHPMNCVNWYGAD